MTEVSENSEWATVTSTEMEIPATEQAPTVVSVSDSTEVPTEAPTEASTETPAPAPVPVRPPRKRHIPSKLRELFTVEMCVGAGVGAGAPDGAGGVDVGHAQQLHHGRLSLLSMVHTVTWEDDVELYVMCNLHPLLLARLLKRSQHEKRPITTLATTVATNLAKLWREKSNPELHQQWVQEVLDGANSVLRLGVFGNPISETAALMELDAELLQILVKNVVVEWDPPTQCAVVGRLCELQQMDAAREASRHVVSGAALLLLGSTNETTNKKLSELRTLNLATIAATALRSLTLDPKLKTFAHRVLALRVSTNKDEEGVSGDAGQDGGEVGGEVAPPLTDEEQDQDQEQESEDEDEDEDEGEGPSKETQETVAAGDADVGGTDDSGPDARHHDTVASTEHL